MKSLVAARARLFLVRIMAICSAYSRNILRIYSNIGQLKQDLDAVAH